MATQNEPSLPLSNSDERKSSDLLPRFYRTDSNKKFFSATLDQLLQPGKAKKLTGFIGRKNAKAVKASDVFVEASDSVRQNYQLEPVAVIQDYLGNTNFYKDYIDHVNHIDTNGGNVLNHERMNRQEFYSWNPHINWDKFVNFQQYYWMPYGPGVINVAGQQQDIDSTYTVTVEDQGDNYVYLFSPDGLTRNPALTLFRGQTYNFDITAPNNPFTIKTSRVSGSLEKYTSGVSASSVENGIVTFNVPLDAPDVLFYVSEADANTGGVLQIKDIDENTFLDVNADILGKKTYTLSSGVALTNGMQLQFTGIVIPEKYSSGRWFVEGVGTAIKLVAESDLEIISSYSQEKALLFDDEPFDKAPFSTLTSFPKIKDYVVVNRSSPDRNQWARYNRWFHQDVVIATANANGIIPELDQTQRATRPIIEFEAGLKLFNFGHAAKQNVDVIDTYTTDVFSTIEGRTGYNVDGVDLSDGMRVLFTADTDRYVNGKIFKVNFITVTNPGRRIDFNAEFEVDINNDIITFSTEHSLITGSQVTYLNNANLSIPGLVNRKIYYVSVINTTQIRLYTDKTLSTRVNIFAVGVNSHTLETFTGLSRQINLVEDIDSTPNKNETVLVKLGTNNQGSMYWYNGSTWKLGQQKTIVNQAPLFDIFDNTGTSYGDITVYDGSNFTGTKVFSYKVGTGTTDTALGFPLSYQNISNIGDIVFEFNLLKDSFSYKNISSVLTKNTNVGFLKVISSLETYVYQNGWTKSEITNSQPVVRIFKESGLVNNFPIDVYDLKDELDDLVVKVYINGRRQNKETFSIVDGVVRKSVVLTTDVTTDDVVTLKCYSAQHKNNNGYYEIPLNLQNNPLNQDVTQFTLGEVIDHVDSIVENINGFVGTYPGYGNLRDIGSLTAYGTRFVQHSGPMNSSLYHFGSRTANVIKGLNQARIDYGKFKRAFITAATDLGIDTDSRRHVDYILEELSKDKTKTQPYYLSDMFAHAGGKRSEYLVLDSRVTTYPLTTAFNLTSLSNRAVSIYLNGLQLVHGKDYTFGDDVFFEILADLTDGDIIEAFEFDSTDGSFCPATPTKLGLFPAYEPAIFVDTTYLEPTRVIQGHDGSITIAFNDYRDDLILELETRIYNNIKIKYDTTIFDIYDFIPGYSRSTAYSKEEFDLILSQYFFEWTSNISQDYTKQDSALWDRLNPFTWNFRNNSTPDNTDSPAFWRGIYRWTLDTDRPHTHPWECLGFSVKPTWWDTVYGPSPYTSNNYILWDDIKNGIVREPGVPIRTLTKFAKSILTTGAPVDEDGNILDPYNAGQVQGYINPTAAGYYAFGDVGPVESAWRRSSYYAFGVIQTALLMQPNHVLATCLDRSRTVRNLNNQLVYADTNLRVKLADIKIPSTSLSSTRVHTAGLINYIVDYITSDTTLLVTEYASDLLSLTNNIGSKLGGFTSKPKFKLLLDSKNVSSSGGIFIPEENYHIISNVSSPIKKIVYSGVAITKYADGYEVRGYNIDHPYFTYYPYTLTGRVVNVGGISESYSTWESGKYYIVGKLIKANNLYYRCTVAHTSGDIFETSNFARIAELPVTGGRTAELRKAWDLNNPQNISYGTKFTTVQDVVDFLQGYGAYLTAQGFVFDEFNNSLKTINNWETSVQEFLFWTTQNWSEGAILALSPAANSLILTSNSAVVNNIQDSFFEYKVFRVDGQKLEANFTNTFREGNTFTLSPSNTNHGIYGASLYLVQKEHVVLLDNTTLFNDVIYDQAPGYRQERIKVIGYISTNWNGGYNIPGFIYDQARIQDWTSWSDYNLGDIVKYKEFYYSATAFLAGTETFNSYSWIKLDEKPEAQLLPNWEYKAMQFTDFYSLDSDNFDTGQQKMAQHLIGYQKRQYLENIIQDDVSQYKFYQGMIIEKGSLNVFSKLFDVLSADDQESLSFNEEWAIRVGNYGSTDTFNELEFKLDESRFKLNPQPFELVSTIDPNVVDFVYRQLPTDVYIKPVGYNNNPWSVDGTSSYLRTPGYVRYEDVRENIDTLADIVDSDISNFIDGDYVWCAFENKTVTVNNSTEVWNWDIYRFTKTSFNITNASYTNNKLTLECDRIPNLVAGDIIGISNTTTIDGFYTITSILHQQITINTTITGWTNPFTDSLNVVSYYFKSVRVSNVDDMNLSITNNIKPGELVWADNNGQGLYAVYENNKIFNQATLTNLEPANNQNFGKTVAISPDGQTAIIAAENNKVLVYSKDASSNIWILNADIIFDTTQPDSGLLFGTSIAFSPDGQWLAISAPGASDVDASGLDEQGYVGIYSRASSNSFDLYKTVISQNPSDNEKFGSNVVFGMEPAVVTTSTSVIADGIQLSTITVTTYYMAVTAADAVYTYKNVITRTTTTVNNISDLVLESASDWLPFGTVLTEGTGDEFGHSISMSTNGKILAVSAPGTSLEAGAVYVYQLASGQYDLVATLDDGNASDRFGESVSISPNGTLLAVGCPYINTNTGKVFVYKSPTFNLHQTLVSNEHEAGEIFGLTVKSTDTSLMVFSSNGDVEREATFNDGGLVTFDNNSTRIVDIQVDAGRIDIYDLYNTKYIYGESLDTSSDNDNTDLYGYSFAVSNNNILVGAPSSSVFAVKDGTVYAYLRPAGTKSWSIKNQENLRPNAYKIKKAFVYNRTTNELAAYMDVVDPIQGKIPGPADQEISYKTFFDPATYSVGTNTVNVDDGMNWSKAQVGMLWWDLTRAKFLDNQAGGVVYRSTTWNTLYETASIDIYEWIETKYLPSEWDKLSGTDKGNSLGISGTSKYGDAVYSVKKRYDSVSQAFQNTYYYWVLNPTVAPNIIGRSLSAYSVSRLISDPVSEGYSCIALTGTNSFSLVNVTNLIDSTNFNLTIQYWIVDMNYTTSNAHNQWKILSEHPNTIIPPEIEKKWIHSLVGKDNNDRVVPDIKLPFKQRYGIGFRPRQSMFVNRVEALKQYIERVNSVLATKLIADDYDLTDLEQFNNTPSTSTGEWDINIDTNLELRFVGVATLQQAELTPIILDGRLIGANIIQAGYGYVNAPYVSIAGVGRYGSVRTVINVAGQVTGVEIISTGEGYLDNTVFTIRPFTVLVSSDTSTFDKWSTYRWNTTDLLWERNKGQSYDVSRYWSYIDWYSSGYNQFTKIDRVVENTYELATLDSSIGTIVKVNNIGSGGWLLLEKYNNAVTIDYTQNYKVVGRNNGTIKFSSALYDYTAIGYDSSLFDSIIYDNLAENELKIIIETIRNKILVDEFRVEYLKLFFASVRYALYEQTFVDWAFKTSFVKATHNVGSLKQKVNYNSDNLENFEDYIKEVKPYRTQIREYISSYTGLDKSQTSVTDFDLLPSINSKFEVSPVNVKVNDLGEIETTSTEITTYPWKHWYDHVGFTVQSIVLVDGGSGYISNPVVLIEGGFGSGASAKAYISNGQVNRIQLVTNGSGYLKAPTITLSGGISVGGTPARASVIIESEVVRANKISVKFDRITRNYFVTELTETETFTGTGSKLQFALKFSPQTKTDSDCYVRVNNVDILRDEYTLTTKTSTAKGFTSYSGLLTLTTAPAVGLTIEITYKKNFAHLSAADRINFYYNPVSGMYGKDLSQLMTGIDYGGTSITGLGFNISGGWDSLPWFTDSWDGFDATFDDRIFTAGAGDYTYDLQYAPANGEEINVYVNGNRIDDPNFTSYPMPGKPFVVMTPLVGNGTLEVFTLPSTNLTIANGDKIIFRRSTSDGSFAPLANEYDTQLSGGNISYATASGLSPDDIILDGDGLVTPMTSAAPEEIVPGHITDAVAIKVFQLPTSAAAKIAFNSQRADGISNEFSLGQIPANFASIFVKVNNLILKERVGIVANGYTVNWQEQKVVLTNTPTVGQLVDIITFGVASNDLLDTNYFVSDGTTTEFITNAPWLLSGLGSVVLVNGETIPYVLFNTNESYDSPNKVGIRFGESPTAGALITYMLTSDQNQSASIIKTEDIVGNNTTQTFTLSNTLGEAQPFANNILVIKNGQVLRPSNTEYFTLADNTLSYTLSTYKTQPYVVNLTDYSVYLDGVELTYGNQYIFDSAGVSVVLKRSVYNENSQLTVVSFANAGYTVDGSVITFNTAPLSTDVVRVTSFYNHNVEEIQRTAEFTSLAGSLTYESYDYFRLENLVSGRFKLNKTVMMDDYVWIIKNNQMLTHSVDYYLDSDLITIKLKDTLISSDVLDVICFNDQVVNSSYGYMQFKDMLNRTHYKRISKAKSTRLARDLKQKDIEIYVMDGAALSSPNPALNLPGIIEINGERIEYFTKVGNVLGQLRRGTLGTGAPELHRYSTLVLDIGPSETIPYADKHIVETSYGNDNTSVTLNYVPQLYDPKPGQRNKDVIDIFIGGYRLKKDDYNLFEESNGYPYSPEGDSEYPAEFSVNGTTANINLANSVADGTKIVVVKKIGKLWTPLTDDLTYANNEIANFIKNTETIFSQYLVDKYQYVLASDEGDTLTTDDNEPLELD